MYSKSRCVDFHWEIQGHEFMALKLGDCDIVLGVDCMRIVSSVIFDFNKLEVTFEIEGKKLTLIGSMEMGACKLISGKKLQKFLKNKISQVAQLFSVQAMEVEGFANSENLEHWISEAVFSGSLQCKSGTLDF